MPTVFIFLLPMLLYLESDKDPFPFPFVIFPNNLFSLTSIFYNVSILKCLNTYIMVSISKFPSCILSNFKWSDVCVCVRVDMRVPLIAQ